MAFFVPVTREGAVGDAIVMVNLELVEQISLIAGSTVVTFSSGQPLSVVETPDQIHDLMKSEMSSF